MTKPSKRQEQQINRQGYSTIAGADEAGRGAWAGPLVAAAVILPREARLPGLNDSKKLSPLQRERLYKNIVALAVSYSISIISSAWIDRYGIAAANQRALRESILGLSPHPQCALIDGFFVSVPGVETKKFIRGDSRVFCIAAASVLAKVTRDRIMVRYHKKFSHYGFHGHKGYGTAQHQLAIKKFGVCRIHRISFSPMADLG